MTGDRFDLGRPTPGELLLTWRRRVGLRQPDAAARLKVSRTALSAAENGAETSLRPPRDVIPAPQDLLRAARRRSGWGLRGTAVRAGVSHVTLLRWEAAADRRLVRFWRAAGYRFPAEGHP